MKMVDKVAVEYCQKITFSHLTELICVYNLSVSSFLGILFIKVDFSQYYHKFEGCIFSTCDINKCYFCIYYYWLI